MEPSLGSPLALAHVACRRAYIHVGVFSLGINVLMLTTPLFMMQVYDRVLTTQHVNTLALLGLVVVFALLTGAVLDASRSAILARVGLWLDRELSGPTVAAIVEQALRSGGPRSAQALRDLAALRGFVSGQGLFPLFDLPWTPVFFTVSFILHPWFGWITLAGGLFLLAIAIFNELATRAPTQQAGTAMAAALNEADAALRNADAIGAMGMLPALVRRWRDRQDLVLLPLAVASQRGAFYASSAKAARLLLQNAILGVGALLAIDGVVSGGAIMAASIIMGRAVAPFEQAIGTWKALLTAHAAYQRLAGVFNGWVSRVEPLRLPRPEGQLVLDQLSWRPPGRSEPVIRRVSFELSAGEALGVIGPSASGKTTLARLIVGSLMPSAGTVRLDGANVNLIHTSDRNAYIGYLPQDVELFNGSVAENISRLGDALPDAIVKAATLAGAHEMILSLDKGYETTIGENGVVLSGGQRQRIGLARALFGDPRLVVLDEPNSHLDGSGEEALIAAIGALRGAGVTVVMIAQRMGAAARMDKILVLRRGVLQNFGTREEVLGRLGFVGQSIGPRGAASGLTETRP